MPWAKVIHISLLKSVHMPPIVLFGTSVVTGNHRRPLSIDVDLNAGLLFFQDISTRIGLCRLTGSHLNIAHSFHLCSHLCERDKVCTLFP